MSVLLAKPYDPAKHSPVGWWLSEKLDGVRALWTGTEFVSRTGKLFYAPAWFTEYLPGYELDGELFIGRGMFQKTVSVVRKKVPIDSEWEQVSFQVFDCPFMHDLPFEDRYEHLKGLLFPYVRPIILVEQELCRDVQQLMAYYQEIIKLGGEGVMLREPGSLYVRKRHGSLLKMKEVIDGLAMVQGVQPGEGKHTGRMGALEVIEIGAKAHTPGDVIKPAMVNFKVGTGFSDAEREEDWPVGTKIRWAAQERTDAGIPRFPRFLCRHEGD